jgi:hypothetical protein
MQNQVFQVDFPLKFPDSVILYDFELPLHFAFTPTFLYKMPKILAEEYKLCNFVHSCVLLTEQVGVL